jgi:hypothetical protein
MTSAAPGVNQRRDGRDNLLLAERLRAKTAPSLINSSSTKCRRSLIADEQLAVARTLSSGRSLVRRIGDLPPGAVRRVRAITLEMSFDGLSIPREWGVLAFWPPLLLLRCKREVKSGPRRR